MRCAEIFPRLNLIDPSLRRTLAEREPAFDAYAFWIAARRARVRMDRIDHGPTFLVGSYQGKPAVAEPPDALEHGVGAAAQPKGDPPPNPPPTLPPNPY